MQKLGVASAVHILLIRTASGKFCPMKIAVPREPIMFRVIRKYIDFSPETLEQMSWFTTFISGCSLIMTGVSLFLNQIPIFALLSLAGGAVLCALSGAIYHARSLRENDKSKEAK
ncbi:hypothetical protein AMM99_24865 [Salmonella enterica]|uniref:Inner membrane protein n=1 Tax=Salmonella enterica TaxID=28901 RepID=A0A5U4CVR2_SALER|nr:hypothetical protein [Salmonella enterica]